MKSQILKIAGVKSEKEFYKKYPTEKAFFKAHPEAKSIKKAQSGFNTDANNNGIPDYLELNPPTSNQAFGPQNQWNFGSNMSSTPSFGAPSVQQMAGNTFQSSGDPFAMQNYGQQWGQQNPLPSNNPNSQFSNGVFGSGSTGGSSKGGGFNMQGFGNVFSGAVEGFQQINAEKELTKKLETWANVSDVVKKAGISNAYAEKPKRQWFRPDDKRFINNASEKYNTQGRGTDILATQNGGGIGGNPTEVQNTYAPEHTLFDDLGYEPLQNDQQIKAFAGGGGFGQWWGQANSGLSGNNNTSFMSNVGQGSPFDSTVSGMFGNNGGSKVGGSLGSLFGPVGSLAGTMIGGYFDKEPGKQAFQQGRINANNDFLSRLDISNGIAGGLSSMGVGENGANLDGGWVSHDWQPQVIATFGEHKVKDLLKPPHDAEMLRAGGHLREYTAPSARAMETYENGGGITSYAMGGQLKTHWGGEARPIAQNPYLPGSGEIIMLDGASHDNDGIGISYGNAQNGMEVDAQIEAEGGEPIIELPSNDGSSTEAVVFGNIPFSKKVADATGDESLINLAKKYDGKTYKSIVANLGKQQNKANKTKLKAADLANTSDDNTQWGELDRKTAEMMHNGADSTLKNYADDIMKLAKLQNATQDVKKEVSYMKGKNISAEALGKGKIENDYDPITKDAEIENPYAKSGAFLRKAQNSTTVNKLGKHAFPSTGFGPIINNTTEDTTINPADYDTNAIKNIQDAMSKGKGAEWFGKEYGKEFGDKTLRNYRDYVLSNMMEQYPQSSYNTVGYDFDNNIKGDDVKKYVKEKFYKDGKFKLPNKFEADALGLTPEGYKYIGKDKQSAPATTTSSNTTNAPTSTDDANYVSKYGITPWQGNTSKGNKYGKKTASGFSAKQWDEIADKLGFKGKGNKEFQEFLMSDPRSAPLIKARHQNLYGKDPWVDPEHFGYGWAANELLLPNPAEVPADTTPTQPAKEYKKTETIPYERNKLIDIANMISPLFRNDQLPPLDPRQLAGEYMSIAQNQYEPVPLQQYTTELDPIYRISYQDTRDQNTADFRDVQRNLGYNPAALAGLLGKKYMANNAVNAEEFRTNQAIENQIYGGNRAKINQQNMANIQLRADQMNKQELAKSKTKETQQAAIASIADKYNQHDARNLEYNVYKNMFPQYGFDSSGRIHNQGPWFQPNIPQIYGNKATLKQVPVYGPDGKTIDHYELQPYNPNDTTTETTTAPYQTPGIVAAKKNGGKVTKNNKNSSIVKAYKNL